MDIKSKSHSNRVRGSLCIKSLARVALVSTVAYSAPLKESLKLPPVTLTSYTQANFKSLYIDLEKTCKGPSMMMCNLAEVREDSVD